MDDLINTDEIFDYIINFLTKKINSPEINVKIQTEIIKPITQLIIDYIYPYFITTIVIICLMFFCIIGSFILLLKK